MLELCQKERPNDEAALWDLLKQKDTFKNVFTDCADNFIKNVIKPKWRSTQESYGSQSAATVGCDMMMMHSALCMGEGKIKISSRQHCRDLISTSVLFSPDLSKSAVGETDFKPHEFDICEEPIVAEALRQFGDQQINKHTITFSHASATAFDPRLRRWSRLSKAI